MTLVAAVVLVVMMLTKGFGNSFRNLNSENSNTNNNSNNNNNIIELYRQKSDSLCKFRIQFQFHKLNEQTNNPTTRQATPKVIRTDGRPAPHLAASLSFFLRALLFFLNNLFFCCCCCCWVPLLTWFLLVSWFIAAGGDLFYFASFRFSLAFLI